MTTRRTLEIGGRTLVCLARPALAVAVPRLDLAGSPLGVPSSVSASRR